MCPAPVVPQSAGGELESASAPAPAADRSVVTSSTASDSDAEECARPEAPPYEPLRYDDTFGAAPRVLLALLTLPPGAYFRPPTSACQDVLVLARDGELQATGTGIAPPAAPLTLYPDDAVRFGAEGDGVLFSSGAEPAHAILAVARDVERFHRGYDDGALEPRGGDCVRNADSGAIGVRVGSLATTEVLRPSPSLDVRVVLDGENTGGGMASLAVLEGRAPLAFAPEVSASGEVLWFERGEGVLTVGDRRLDVHAGMRVYVPEGVSRSFVSTAPDLRLLQLFAPAGAERRFRVTR